MQQLRLLVSPIRTSATIDELTRRVEALAGVRAATLDQFVGETAVISVSATTAGDVVAGLLRLEGFPLAGLTLTADGEVSIRLQDDAADAQSAATDARERVTSDAGGARAEPPRRPAAAVQPAPYTAADTGRRYALDLTAIERLRATLQRLSAQLDALLAEAPPSRGPSSSLHPDTAAAEAFERRPVSTGVSVPMPPHAQEDGSGAAASERSSARPAVEPVNDRTAAGAGWYDDSDALAQAEHPWKAEPGPPPEGRMSGTSARVADASPLPRRTGEAAQRRLQLVAYPFENFSLVNSFIDALRRLPGVRHVAPRRFRGGTIDLQVDYAGPQPLSEQLRNLTAYVPQIESDDGETVSVRLSPLAPAR